MFGSNLPLRPRLLTLAIALTLAVSTSAQTPQAAQKPDAAPKAMPVAKRNLVVEDYKNWEILGDRQISNDGRWLSYQIGLVDGDGYLVVRSSDEPKIVRVPFASRAKFSDDSKWVAYFIGVPKAQADAAREEKKPIFTKLGLRNLVTGQEQVIESVQDFAFLKGSKSLVIHRFRGVTKPEGGSDLVVQNLKTGAGLTIGNVVDFDANREGSLLAVAVKSDSGEGGVQVLDLTTSVLRSVVWGKEAVRGLTFAKNGETLGFMLGTTDEKKEGDANRVVLANKLRSNPEITAFDGTGVPAGFRISENGGLQLSEDGTAAAFGVAPWLDKKKKPTKPPERATPEVWNTKDLRVISRQKVTAAADRARSEITIWKVGSPAVKFTNNDMESAAIIGDFKGVLITDEKPYTTASNNGFDYSDVYVADIATGKRTPVLTKTHWGASPSPKGGYLSYYKERNWWTYDIAKGAHFNATAAAHTNFENIQDDHTVAEKPPVDGPHWLANDAGFVVSDFNDAYLVRTGSTSVTQLTEGRKESLRFRYVELDRQAEDPQMITEKLYLSVFSEETKGSGLAVAEANGKNKVLVFDDARLTNFLKSKDTDRLVYQSETFEKSPGLFLTNLAFTAAKPVAKTNPQQAMFNWGKTELVQYKSRFGVPLRGQLIYPAGYDKTRRYPMVTYIYERLTDRLHAYIGPTDWSAYNPQVLSQNGYFVFLPDIVYTPRNPGKNAVDCLEPAVAAVLAKNVGVDGDRVGLIGHSWGGYQTAFVTTVSKVFKVGVAGAPLTELTSMYNSNYWNSGTPNQEIFESSQGRLNIPFWDDPKSYIENSAVWQSRKRTAPILFTFGYEDGAVDYHQGLYLYNTLRRIGKEAVLLMYAGENHNFTKRPDQLDYAKRVRHYLDVYLKGAKPESWITDGVPFLKQGE